ncbi:MAG: membrane dipeptidase [FCB group bacterium]|nr:membrane dipeptidase [FCB group bacterium]
MKNLIILAGLTLIPLSGCVQEKIDYQVLHRDALVADTHSDTPLRMLKGFDFAVRDTTGHMDIPRLQEGGVDLQVFACWLSTDTPIEECRSKTDKLIDSLTAQVERHPDKIAFCHTAAEAEEIIASGKIAAFIGIENGVAIENSLDNLQHYYDRGVRYMTLTHTASGDWCISSADTLPAFEGLTDFGREVVKKMNELGMIVDISHSSVRAVEEILKVTIDPVIASHSCVHAICPHDRNLTDDQIKAVAKNGGMIGINFYGGYISAEWNQLSDSFWTAHQVEVDSIKALYPNDYSLRQQAYKPLLAEMRVLREKLNVDVGSVVDHIDYIVKLVGPDHVGFGSDFDGVYGLPQGLTDCSMVPSITEELVNRGYGKADIRKILGGNFMRVFRTVCDK